MYMQGCVIGLRREEVGDKGQGLGGKDVKIRKMFPASAAYTSLWDRKGKYKLL